MSIQINYKSNGPKKSSNNLILFADEKFNINPLKNYISTSEFSYIKELLRSSDISKNLLIFELNSKRKIVLVSIKNNLKNSEIENLGAELYGRINYGKSSEYFLNSDSAVCKYENFVGHLLHGLKLKSYEFNKYKTKKVTRLIKVSVYGKKIKFLFTIN